MTTERARMELDVAIEAFGQARHDRGYERGLRIADKICGHLTRQPDTGRQRESREWGERLIAEARKGLRTP